MRLRKSLTVITLIVITSTLLSGCLYPKERRAENQVPHTYYVESTQKAVEQFQADSSVLPIVTKPLDTPIFEKYEIDFARLMPKYLPDAPANAFEKGGIYKYTLIDVETKPTVRLIHLGNVSLVADVQMAVNRYKANYDKLPVKQDIGHGYYAIDFKAIAMKDTQITSPFSNSFLPLIMNNKGEVGIDYSLDLAQLIKKPEVTIPAKSDPRYVLARESMFVPIKSFPYGIENGEPVLLDAN